MLRSRRYPRGRRSTDPSTGSTSSRASCTSAAVTSAKRMIRGGDITDADAAPVTVSRAVRSRLPTGEDPAERSEVGDEREERESERYRQAHRGEPLMNVLEAQPSQNGPDQPPARAPVRNATRRMAEPTKTF